jgi:rhodanese-related sulfurtransferase
MQYEEEQQAPYKTISAEEARKMIEAGTRIIDVRRPEEWDRGHIAEADLIPVEAGVYAFGTELQKLNLVPDEKVIFTCAAGHRSIIACEIALLMGFKDVYNLANGMSGWTFHGYPVER